MKQNLDSRVVIGVVVVVLVGVVFFGYRYVTGGAKPGEKPALDPVLNRMYGPHTQSGASGQTNATQQGQ